MPHDHLTVKCKGCKQTYCIRCFEPTDHAPRAATTHTVHASAQPNGPESE